MGNFAKANHLLGLALEKHRDIMGVSSPLLPVGCTEPITPAFDCRRRTPGAEDTDCRDRTSLYEVSSYDSDDLDYDTDEMSLSLSDDEYECDDDCGCLSMEGESFSQDFPPQNPPHNSHHQQQQHGVTHNTPSNSPAIDESHSSASGYGIPRMTTFSQVHTVPYCGQQERIASLRQQEQDHGHNTQFHLFEDTVTSCYWGYQEVYSLPIVMDEHEWDSASMGDRSFVLVFNSAVTNHLLGMALLSLMGCGASTNTRIRTNCDGHKGPLRTAKALYMLAFETLELKGTDSSFPCNNNTDTGGRIRSVDKLCVPAIFNNLSHICKTLDGYSSQEAYDYDNVLLKSVYWWIDGSTATGMTSNSGLRERNSSSKTRGGGDDWDVIDAFLETVFYLVGVPQVVAPAGAA